MHEEKNSRRKPTQSRSRMTVESILEATRQLLERGKYSDLTTTRIADRVGISVGSLYQYFPDKEAIVEAVYEETVMEVAKELRDQMYKDAILTDDALTSKEEGLYKTIEIALDLYTKHAAILIGLEEEVPAIRDHHSSLSINSLLYNAARLFMKSRPPKVDLDPDLISFAMDGVIFDSIKRYCKADPKPGDRDEFITIVSGIVLSYYRSIGVVTD